MKISYNNAQGKARQGKARQGKAWHISSAQLRVSHFTPSRTKSINNVIWNKSCQFNSIQ